MMWRGDGVETTSAPSSNDARASDTGLFAFEAAGLAWLREAHEEHQGVPIPWVRDFDRNQSDAGLRRDDCAERGGGRRVRRSIGPHASV